MKFEVKIEDSVPLPNRNVIQDSPMMKTLKEMKVGQSFAFPKQHRDSIRTSAKRANVGIEMRSNPDGTVRVWKTVECLPVADLAARKRASVNKWRAKNPERVKQYFKNWKAKKSLGPGLSGREGITPPSCDAQSGMAPQ